MKSLIQLLASQSGLGLAVIRVATGAILLLAGYGKVFHGGFAVGFFGKVGIPLPQVAGPFVSFLELGGGALLIVGLFTRYLGVLFTLQFIVVTYVKWVVMAQGYGGARIDIMILVAVFLLATNGAGALAMDRAGQKWEP